MQFWAVVLFGAAVAGSVSTTRVARAGCPNPCDLTVGQPTLEPDLPCVNLKVTSKSCDCGALLVIDNGCAVPIEALDFVLDSCWSDGRPLVGDCSLEPDRSASFMIEFGETGEKETSLRVRSDGIDHTLTVTSNVTSLGSGGFCSIGRVPVSLRLTSEFLAVAFGLASAAVGRRAARAQRSKR